MFYEGGKNLQKKTGDRGKDTKKCFSDKMDRNSVHTSVVIEVANQEEPEDQKTYQIDFDELDIPKDYVIDEVFCGENITVYALFEVPEDANVATDDRLLDVSSPKMAEGYRFFQRNFSKKIASQKKLNGFKQMEPEESVAKLLPGRDNGTESFYCLKHLSEEYDVLTPERENSDLKILYSKSACANSSKSTKFKAVSKGVNTDIVQSPRIIQELQRAVKHNIPFSKEDKGTVRDKSPSSGKPSNVVIEMEMPHSFSSLSSQGDSIKPNRKSAPNFFLVPLLMMDDGVLSHFQSDDGTIKVEDKIVVEQPADKKITTGTNTEIESTKTAKKKEDGIDINLLQSFKSENDENRNLIEKQTNSNSQPKLNRSKLTILSEIKKLQGKLNTLIESMESTDFTLDESDSETITVKSTTEKADTWDTLLTEVKSQNNNWNKFDDVPIPILSSMTYPLCREKSGGRKKQAESSTEEKSDDISITPTKSISMDIISSVAPSKSESARTESKSKEELKTIASEFRIDLSEVECHRGAGLSKSAATLSTQLDPKLNLINGMRKSLSLDLKDDKLEVYCLKKIKNASFKLDAKPNIRIPQKGEDNLKCEMGDEAFNKPKSSKMDLLTLSKAIEKVENLQLDKINLDPQKNIKEEEGDAKSVYSKKNMLSQMLSRTTENVEVHFCNTITRASENLLLSERSLLPNPVKSKPTCNSVDTELKASSDLDKPTTPNKSVRKGPKREVKTVKKLTNQTNKNKVGEKPPKVDGKDLNVQDMTPKQKIVKGIKKFSRGTGESKTQVDRLVKPESPKANVEKAGTKSDRPSRLPSQKREPTEPPHDVPTAEMKEKTGKMENTTKTTSSTSLNKKEVKEVPEIRKNEKTREKISEENPASSVAMPAGVVVELFAEKPTFPPQKNQLCANLKNNPPANMSVANNPNEQEQVDSLNLEKPVVKSVWALTKVLLFEDGTKKIEILEASLTPPGFSLPDKPPE